MKFKIHIHRLLVPILLAAVFSVQGGDVKPSPTLMPELKKFVEESIRKEILAKPDAKVSEEELSKLKNGMVEGLTFLFLVTEDQEAKFAKGEFNDTENKAKMEKQLALFNMMTNDLNIAVPDFAAQSAKDFKAGTLSGLKLECALRLNNLVAMKMQHALKKVKNE